MTHRADAAQDRAPDVAVLRRPAHPGRSLADSRQLPGRTATTWSRIARRRPTSACSCSRRFAALRLRLPQRLRRRRSARADLRHAAQAAALPRALLQLVRHAHAGATAPELRLHGRQRQPRRLPADRAQADCCSWPTSRDSTHARSTGCATPSGCARSAWRRRPGCCDSHAGSALGARDRGAARARWRERRRPRRRRVAGAARPHRRTPRRDRRRCCTSTRTRASAAGEEADIAAAAQWLDRVAVALAQRRADLQPTDADRAALDRTRRAARRDSPTISSRRWTSASSSTAAAPAVLDRLQRHRRPARRLLLRRAGSEARLASFVAIATGQIPHEHWFKLGRSLTPTGTRARAALVERVDVRVLHAAAGDARVSRHAARRNLPRRHRPADAVRRRPARSRGASPSRPTTPRTSTGTTSTAPSACPASASSAASRDDLVIAPYASILAAPLVAVDVLRNLERLRAARPVGPVRVLRSDRLHARRVLPDGPARGVVLPTFMAHHQGMILVALDNALHDFPMQRRFHADPRVQAADLLLQERIPHQVPLKNPPIELADHVPSARAAHGGDARVYTTPHTLSPRPHLLSNGSYVVDGHQCRRRLQPPPADRDDALARGRHDRRLGQLLLRPRPRSRPGLVDRLPADRARARRIRMHVRARPRRVPPRRRRHRDPHRDRRVARRRCRAAPGVGHQPRHRRRAGST